MEKKKSGGQNDNNPVIEQTEPRYSVEEALCCDLKSVWKTIFIVLVLDLKYSHEN